ncbi:hypothetical protein GCM10010320_54700 [Streptomyces caelestis]|nr:hypothetical protein GCM10010320_54700 [Streptomyces caelestis]
MNDRVPTNSPSGTGTPEGGVASPSPEEGGGTARGPRTDAHTELGGERGPGEHHPECVPYAPRTLRK